MNKREQKALFCFTSKAKIVIIVMIQKRKEVRAWKKI